jgi:hypothetical protein
VAGLTANRSDVQLDREVAILILEKKGAPFGFPITPDVNTPEKLCGWLQEEPPADYLDWGRDPRLVPGGIGAWQAIQHTATGVGMLVFNLLGRWSSAAFLSLADSMRVLLPSRHKLDILKQGVLRVCICLSVTSRWNRRAPAVYEELDTANVTASLQRTYSAIARMAAAKENYLCRRRRLMQRFLGSPLFIAHCLMKPLALSVKPNMYRQLIRQIRILIKRIGLNCITVLIPGESASPRLRSHSTFAPWLPWTTCVVT